MPSTTNTPSTPTYRRWRYTVGVAVAFLAAAALSSATPGVAHAAEPLVATISKGTPVYSKPLDDWRCPTLGLCRDAPSSNAAVGANVPVAWQADRPKTTVELICSVGAFTKLRWATDQPPGWVDVRAVQTHPQTSRVPGKCWPWEMR